MGNKSVVENKTSPTVIVKYITINYGDSNLNSKRPTFETLPNDIHGYIARYLDWKSLMKLRHLSKTLYFITKSKRVLNQFYGCTDSCRMLWVRTHDFIEIEANKISRLTNEGRNPCIKTNRKFLDCRQFFVQILSLGAWISIGLSNQDFPNNGGKVLGNDDRSIGVFQQGAITQFQMRKKALVKIPSLKVNDIVGYVIIGDSCQVFINDIFIYLFVLPEDLQNAYPSVSLGMRSSVALIDREIDIRQIKKSS